MAFGVRILPLPNNLTGWVEICKACYKEVVSGHGMLHVCLVGGNMTRIPTGGIIFLQCNVMHVGDISPFPCLLHHVFSTLWLMLICSTLHSNHCFTLNQQQLVRTIKICCCILLFYLFAFSLVQLLPFCSYLFNLLQTHCFSLAVSVDTHCQIINSHCICAFKIYFETSRFYIFVKLLCYDCTGLVVSFISILCVKL